MSFENKIALEIGKRMFKWLLIIVGAVLLIGIGIGFLIS